MIESRNINKIADLVVGPGLISEEAMVMTSKGPRPLGEIEEGDILVTHDEGSVAVRGLMRTVVSSKGRITPIKIYEIGNSAFYVTPNTLFLIDSSYCRHHFGSAKAFVRAASLRSEWLEDALPGGDFVFISLCLQSRAMINVNGFVCDCSNVWNDESPRIGIGMNATSVEPYEYPILSDEEASAVFKAMGGASNVLSFVGLGGGHARRSSVR